MVFEEVEEEEEKVAVDDEQRDPNFQMEEGGGGGGGGGGGEEEVEDEEDKEMEIGEEVAVVQERAGRGMSRKGAVRGERKRPTIRKSKKDVVSFFYQPYYNWLHDNDWVHN